MIIYVILSNFNVFATIILAAGSPAEQVSAKLFEIVHIDLVDCCLRILPLLTHFMVVKYRYPPDGIARRFPLHYFPQYQAESPSPPLVL